MTIKKKFNDFFFLYSISFLYVNFENYLMKNNFLFKITSKKSKFYILTIFEVNNFFRIFLNKYYFEITRKINI